MPFFPTDIQNKSVKPIDNELSEEISLYTPALSLDRRLISNPASTFFLEIEGKEGDIIIVDKSIEPTIGSTVIIYYEGEFKTHLLENIDNELNIWGVVRYYIKKV